MIQIFNKPDATAGEIETAGEKALVTLYNGRPDTSLNRLRYINAFLRLYEIKIIILRFTDFVDIIFKGTRHSFKKLAPAKSTSKQKASPQQKEPPASTAFVYTTRRNHGWETSWIHFNGGG